MNSNGMRLASSPAATAIMASGTRSTRLAADARFQTGRHHRGYGYRPERHCGSEVSLGSLESPN